MLQIKATSMRGYLQKRAMLKRHGFNQLLCDSQRYVRFNKDKDKALVAYICCGEGVFLISIKKQELCK